LANISSVLFKIVQNIFQGKHFRSDKIDPVLLPMHRCQGLIAFVSKGKGSSSAKEAIDFYATGPDGKADLFFSSKYGCFTLQSAKRRPWSLESMWKS
jgi:hypothetical protein